MTPSDLTMFPLRLLGAAALLLITSTASAEESVALFPAGGEGVKFTRALDDQAGKYEAAELASIFQIEGDEIHVYRDWKHEAAPFATLVSADEYGDCVIELEYQWGERRFAPRADQKRDAGLLFLVRKPEQVWPPCVECQIQETDSGDLWCIYSLVSMRLSDARIYDPQSEPQTLGLTQDFTGINRRDADAAEVPGWNAIRVELRDGAGKYYLNGKLVNVFEKAFEKDGTPLTRGRIAIQAEGAELTYRNVRVRRLP